MPEASSLEFPVTVRPSLPDGPIHRLNLTGAAVEITTSAPETGYLTLLAIPHIRIIEATFVTGLFGNSSCKVTYRDENEQKKVIRIAMMASDQSLIDREQTWAFSQLLEQLRTGRELPPVVENTTFDLTRELNPWSSPPYRKVVYGLVVAIMALILLATFDGRFRVFIIAGIALLAFWLLPWAELTGRKFIAGFLLIGWLFLVPPLFAGSFAEFLIFGSFFLGISLAALGIDYIRLHTKWHPVVKIIGFVVAFGMSLVGMLAIIGIVENLR